MEANAMPDYPIREAENACTIDWTLVSDGGVSYVLTYTNGSGEWAGYMTGRGWEHAGTVSDIVRAFPTNIATAFLRATRRVWDSRAWPTEWSAECWVEGCQNLLTRHSCQEFYADDDTATYHVCAIHAEDYPTCEHCATTTEQTYTVYYVNTWSGRNTEQEWCYGCYADESYICAECNYSFTELRGNDRCRDCYSCECYEHGCEDCWGGYCECYECQDEDSDDALIHSYDYKPNPTFWALDESGDAVDAGDPTPGTPYLGMELEVTISNAGSGAEVVTEAASDVVYCKHDGSVDGFEMVTHPMTLEAARELIPFDALRVLRNEYRASAWTNGIHVHVSRDGFTNDSHVYRWMKLLYRNAEDVQRIARRKSEQWAAFDNGSRREHKRTAKKRANNARYDVSRYSAVNVQNRDTFEVRVFRGSLRKDEIMAALELVAASVEYARQLTTRQVARDGGWKWDTFITWAHAQGETYANLVALDAKTRQQPLFDMEDTNAA